MQPATMTEKMSSSIRQTMNTTFQEHVSLILKTEFSRESLDNQDIVHYIIQRIYFMALMDRVLVIIGHSDMHKAPQVIIKYDYMNDLIYVIHS